MTAASATNEPGLGWIDIVRLGLVQTALGAIVVLTTSTMNRIMVVELALPAMLPGVLVGLHYAVQMSRPRMGHGSDRGRRRTPWILGGMAVLAAGGVGASTAIAVMGQDTLAGVALAVVAFVLIGAGVGAAGTSLLVLLATGVSPARRAPAASIVWIMMIAGFAVTATAVGEVLDPYTPRRLIAITAAVGVAALGITLLGVLGIERRALAVRAPSATGAAAHPPFRQALRQVWAEPQARHFTIFVFVSMLAYSAQDLILEPFAGLVFGMTPGESTKLSGIQHAGVLAGMLLVAVAGATLRGLAGSLRVWAIGGCLGSAVALAGLAVGGLAAPERYPLQINVMLLGAANGAFAVAAIGSMMGLAGQGRQAREGVRMGLWGAAQAIAFGLGGFLGTVGIDVMRAFLAQPALAYASVFVAEAMLFVIAAQLAARIKRSAPVQKPVGLSGAAEGFVSGVGN